ncbi:MAG: ECF transporter S component [Solirubrobacterales bacterium]
MNPKVRFITRTALFLAIALGMQFLKLPQPITGPVINAVLILAVVYAGVSGAVLIGLLTPLIAYLVGILPPPLMPLIPVIMIANAILAIVFFFGRRINDWTGIGLAAVLKFLVFAAAIKGVFSFMHIVLPAPLIAGFMVPQLLTALAGGVVAALIIRQFPPETM